MKKFLTTGLWLLAGILWVEATNVQIALNGLSSLELTAQGTTEIISPSSTSSTQYTYDLPAGKYSVKGLKNANTIGSIFMSVDDEDVALKLFTYQCYASNVGWVYNSDYTIHLRVASREGENQNATMGTDGSKPTFLIWEGNTYYADYVPSQAHQNDGYATGHKSATVTFASTAIISIPMAYAYRITIPADAHLYVGLKSSHYVSFMEENPVSEQTVGGEKVFTFRLAKEQVYNFRTWKEGQMTIAGYFTMSDNAANVPTLHFTNADYAAYNPKQINHSVSSNQGYETGNIFVNINKENHLRLAVNDSFDVLALRSWQLTDNSTNNYFIEPTFHYTVYDLEGNPSTDVIEIDNAHTTTNPWAKIRAKAPGTAVVTVTYDAINLNYYAKSVKTPYLGGENWGAIWPENTAVVVVTVGGKETAMVPNMLLNQEYNLDAKKVAGKYVDAEHDVFYFLNEDDHYDYTFTPADVATVDIMYPTIREHDAIYNTGFQSVLKNNDNSYTLALREGRQIVRMGDGKGNYIYQVLTAKHATRTITVAGRADNSFVLPGDKVTIQYAGLFHPANKMSGIYNMSAYVTYNGVPNGESLILGSGQYTFASAPSAQAVTMTIPSDWDAAANPVFTMNDGVIQVNGFGDPIGNHRYISKTMGRNANFTAVAHKTYFGAIPDINLSVKAVKPFFVKIVPNLEETAIEVKNHNGIVLTPSEQGQYEVTYGMVSYRVTKAGYTPATGTHEVTDEDEELITLHATLEPTAPNSWDGLTRSEPTLKNGYYEITSGYELAWFANKVNVGKAYTAKAKLMNDIDLNNQEWTPIGGTSANTGFKGEFAGQGYSITGLKISSTSTYRGLFGYCSSNTCSLHDFSLYGHISTTKSYVGGVAAYLAGNTTGPARISRVKNYVTIESEQNNVGGIVGYAKTAVIDRCENHAPISTSYIHASNSHVAGILGYAYDAKTTVTNCINTGKITGVLYASGIVGYTNGATVKNCYNTGEIVCANNSGSISSHSGKRDNFDNNYAVKSFTVEPTCNIIVDANRWTSGEVAYLLGSAFGQEIGVDAYPVIGGKTVYKYEVGERVIYTNAQYEVYSRDDMAENEIGTICLPYASDLFSGATFYSLAYFNATTGKIILDEVTSLQAGQPYIFVADGSPIEIYHEDATVSVPGHHNGLYGTFTDKYFTASDIDTYIVYNNALYEVREGDGVAANRAYIRLSDVPTTAVQPAPGRRRMVLGGVRQTPTSLSETTDSLQSGVEKFISNGCLYIRRDGHVYDVTGQQIQ